MQNFIETVRSELNKMHQRSTWCKGVNEYAQGLVDGLEEDMDGGWISMEDLQPGKIEKILLNGARDWKQYSWGAHGAGLVRDCEIAQRLCTKAELKRTRDGERNPNGKEAWLDVQARALEQAAIRVRHAIREAKRSMNAKEA